MAERLSGGGVEEDDFLEVLDRKLMRSNQRKRAKLQAWAGVLDAAGWCVALPDSPAGFWLSPKARLDLESRGWNPSEPLGFVEMLPAGTMSHGGAMIWASGAGEAGQHLPTAALTNREREVLQWLRVGKSDSEISVILGCAVRTVEKHVSNLYRKLGVSGRTAAILHSTGTAD